MTEHGYTEVSPPFVVGPQCLEGVGQFPKFKDQYYGVAEGDDKEKLGKLYLIPTAETPVANIHREEILPEKQLPMELPHSTKECVLLVLIPEDAPRVGIDEHRLGAIGRHTHGERDRVDIVLRELRAKESGAG